MNSIKARLITTLLLSLGVLWIISSACLYYYTKRSLYKSLDSELQLVAKDAILLTRNLPHQLLRRLRDRTSQFDEKGDFFFQSWTTDGQERRLSKSWGKLQLTNPKNFTKEGVYGYQKLPDGRKLRTLSLLQERPHNLARYGALIKHEHDHEHIHPDNSIHGHPHTHSPPEPSNNLPFNPPQLHVIIAHNTAGVESTLSKLLFGIFASSLAGALTTTIVMHYAVKKGLKPLIKLTDQLGAIDSKNLTMRLDNKTIPDELSGVSVKMNELLDRLEESFERERRFGSNLAHELRTPTAEIQALAELGIKWPDQFGSDDLKTIISSAKRMETTMYALLDLTRLEETSVTNQNESISVKSYVDKHLTAYAAKITDKNLTIVNRIPEDANFMTNPALYDIILHNLVSNAVSHAPTGDQIEIDWNILDDELAFTNTAPHLDKADMDSIFERFWRKGNATASNQHLGLGLRLAKACAEKMQMRMYISLSDEKRLRIRVK